MDGDLIALVQKLVDLRGPGTTAISKVKGHADEGLGAWRSGSGVG